MANKSKSEQMTTLKNVDELCLRHLFVMVLEKYKTGLFGKNQPTFVREYLCDLFQSVFGTIDDSPGTKAGNILDKEIDEHNGPSEINYSDFCDQVLGKTKPGREKDFFALYQQSAHLERKLATKKDELQRNLEKVRSGIGQSFIQILSEKAPWLKKSMDGLQPIPLLEADFYKLLTVATVISLNRNTYTKLEKTNDQVDQLCYHFLFTNIEPEVLPDYSLKMIFDGILEEADRMVVLEPSGEKFRRRGNLTDLDRLRILLSGIPDEYSLLPSDESEECASASQILTNGSDTRIIHNLSGFFGHYSTGIHLDGLWQELSQSIENHMVSFERIRFYSRKTSDDAILKMFPSRYIEDKQRCIDNFVESLQYSVSEWTSDIFEIFLYGHQVEEIITPEKIIDCITAFVLIAVCCLKTKSGGPDNAIPKKREAFKKALIQKIKKVFFPDCHVVVDEMVTVKQEVRDLNVAQLSQEELSRLWVASIELRAQLHILEREIENQLRYLKLHDPERKLLDNLDSTNINANTKFEETDRDTAKSKLLTPDPNSPKGGK